VKMDKKIVQFAIMIFFCVFVNNGWSATNTDIDRLGKDLTAVGAEVAGNKDGSIPAFTGNVSPLPGWSNGKIRREYWPHKDEKPIFTIDATNVDNYIDKLTPGQIALIKKIKGYTMPIYQSYRECGVPDFIAQNTKTGALSAAIGEDGWSLKSATPPMVPFPIPRTGIEAMWNFLMRYQGIAADWPKTCLYLSPRPGANVPITSDASCLYYYPWAREGVSSLEDVNYFLTGIAYQYLSPPALAGQGTMQRYYFNKDSESWLYFPGQRRVRRLPSYAYDAPLIGYENQYPADMSYIFIGNPDRFDWKLIGKKEIFVPYNSFAFSNYQMDISAAAGPDFVKENMRRYELHRVWMIEGTVKSGIRHSAPKKTIYLDEDSWYALVGDDFDTEGKIWKVKENHTIPSWEIDACVQIASVFYDIQSGRYIMDNTVLGGINGSDVKHFKPGEEDNRFNDNYFTSENLGRISER
jgi:hypothetical protein